MTMELLPVACLCLLSCSAAASDEPVTVTVMEDSDAILPCSLGSGENIESRLFDWRKDYQKDGSKDVFMYDGKKQDDSGQSEQFRGRVSHFQDELKNGNASIKVTKTKLADGGVYTCIFPHPRPERKFNIQLVVAPILKDRSRDKKPGASPKPVITTLDVTKDWALLQCEVLGAFPQPEVEWQDSDGNIIPAEGQQVLKSEGRFYVTLNTTVTKTDRYQCVVTQKEIHHQTHAQTSVYINAPEPSVKILDQTKDWSLLQCFVRGASPKPQLQWQDSDGNVVPAKEPQVSERGGSYDVILQATVTKTDTYRCVVTQEEINHQGRAETFVRINDSSAGWIVAGVLSGIMLIVGVILGTLACTGRITLNCKKGSTKSGDDQTAHEAVVEDIRL